MDAEEASGPLAKRLRLDDQHHQQDAAPAAAAAAGPQSLEQQQGLAVMLTSIEEEPSGTLLLWGLTPTTGSPGADSLRRQQQPSERATAGQASLLLVVPDYQPYFHLPCPHALDASGGSSALQEPGAQDLERLRRAFNAQLPDELHIQQLDVLQAAPIMYYRPALPDGLPYLKLSLRPGAPVKKVATAVEKIAAGGLAGFSWRQRGTEAMEADIKLVMRFLSDASLSGGSWLWACPTPTQQPAGGSGSGAAGGGAAGAAAAAGSSAGGAAWRVLPPGTSSRRSSCAVEVVCSWRGLHSLTPDATQLADTAWQPPVLTQLQPLPAQLQTAAAAAAAGDILPLKLAVLDVVQAPADGSDRTCSPAGDPVVVIACQFMHTTSTSHHGAEAAGAADPAGVGAAGSQQQEDGAANAGEGSSSSSSSGGASKVAFVLAGAAASVLPAELRAEGCCVRLCSSERELLLAWRDYLREQDPDGLVVFQVRDNLGVLVARFEALQIDGGSCFASRAAGRFRKPLSTKSVVQYSVAWVKSQSRMAGTSNMETFMPLGLSGRLCVDILRQVLTAQLLATYSLVDCSQSLLDTTLEVIPGHVLAALQRELAAAGSGSSSGGSGPAASDQQQRQEEDGVLPPDQVPPVRAALRLARYSLARCHVVGRLLGRLATVPEAFEMARATGLTLSQVQYNAQMIRTQSLLLRAAHRRGFLLGGRQEAVQLLESPFLIHPVEQKTTGLYKSPVASCDFASLYPSLYRAHNLCYTTLVHPDDAAAIDADQLLTTPTGAAFLKPGVRQGILPGILSALMTARAATRATLKSVQQQQQQGGSGGGGGLGLAQQQLAARAAVLDGRQKALKLTANALYGFTGAPASPLQCAPIADSCLALGAAVTRAAVATINAAIADGTLGGSDAAASSGGRVIYAQTDSVFISFPNATVVQAVALGQAAARLVTDTLPAPMRLSFERVCQPFMLLHVNRYAGCSFETAAAAEAGQGKLLVKGVRAVWRQSAPFVATTLMGALERILMARDVPAAVSFVEREISRLLTGHVGVWELAMTGGLWRVTGQQLEKAAAGAADDAGGGAAGGGGDGDDIKGPHQSLAVKLSRRDPNRKWLLGERLSYVLLTGSRSQDEMAEDPLAAAKQGQTPNYSLYWTHKLQVPLREIFSTCLSPEQLRQLCTGPHTQFRTTTTAAAGDVLASPSAPRFGGLAAAPPQLPPAAAPAPAAAAAGGSKKGRAGSGKKGPAALLGSPAAGAKKKQLQGSMSTYVTAKPRCLGCKAVIASSTSSSSQQGAEEPGLCASCRQEDGKRAAIFVGTVQEQADAARSFCAAHSACRRCHSGGQLGGVVCESSECPVLYARFAAERQLRTAEHSLQRLDW